MSILVVSDLKKSFSKGLWPFQQRTTYDIVKGISFELKKSEVLGFLGPNGAGKTTTIQMLLGAMQPTSGIIMYDDKDFNIHRLEILRTIGYASGYDKFPARLTVAENLDIVGRIYNIPTKERMMRIERLLKFFDMWNLRDKPAGTLSAGQSTRVMLAKAFLGNPTIVLLDEPTAALDPEAAFEVRRFILEQNKQFGISVFITSHNMAEVTELCDRVLVLKFGRIIADAEPEQLARSVSKSRIHLIVTEGKERLINYLTYKNINHAIHEPTITIELDEHMIAHFLTQISEHKIIYTSISIDKPTLEDYFLSIARK